MFPGLQKATETAITIAIDPKVLWITFGVVFSLVVLMSIILLYHWKSYGYKPVKTGIMGTFYFTGLFILLGIMFFAIISYTVSL